MSTDYLATGTMYASSGVAPEPRRRVLPTLRRVTLYVLCVLVVLYCALQPRTYRSHETGSRVITVQLPTGEAGYNSGFFYCRKGDC